MIVLLKAASAIVAGIGIAMSIIGYVEILFLGSPVSFEEIVPRFAFIFAGGVLLGLSVIARAIVEGLDRVNQYYDSISEKRLTPRN